MTLMARIWSLESLDMVPPAVARRLVDALYTQAIQLALGVAGMVMAGALAFARTGATWLLVWTGLSAATGVVRMLQHRAYRRHRNPGNSRLWARRFLVGSWIAGALWGGGGATAVLLLPDPFVVLVLFVVGTGYITGCAVRSNAVPVVVVGQSLFALVPVLVACLAAADPYMRVFAVFVALEVVAMAMITRFLSDMTMRLLLADEEKSRQLAQITKTQMELRRLTEHLEARVREEVAAREAAQTRVAHAERMQALGQLAGGIAHDFNNVLQTVLGSAGLIDRYPEDAAAVRRFARRVIEAAERGASITRRLLAFGHRANLHAETLDVPALLGDLREVLAHTIGAAIEVEVRLGTALPPLLADKGQLETVLVNLATNARDAMPAGGKLVFSAATEIVSSDASPHPAGLVPGRYVRLTVADTGIGMDAATLARAGEPFFTTKKIGAGTGLGLSMTKGFAEQSGGAMSIESCPGRGTTVALWLPASGPDRRSGAAEASPGRNATTPIRVLLIDDEEMIREVVTETLESAGYGVLAAESGAEALALLSAGKDVDVLITDFSMPGMDGLAVIRDVQKRFPGIPAMLLTGYAANSAALAAGGVLSGAFSLLRKPVEGSRLLDGVRALLSEVDRKRS